MKVTIFALVMMTAAAGTAAQRPRPAAEKPALMAVYKTPTCGCCSKWVEHMKQNGFTVNVTDMNDVSPIKTKHGVPSTAQSCHTAIVNGYVIEGHVPAADVKRMLKEKPAIAGLALPGMPSGSPGMEIPGVQSPGYQVLSFDKRGATRVYAKH
jgi:hypothetical protein